jgi:hypothetical protein
MKWNTWPLVCDTLLSGLDACFCDGDVGRGEKLRPAAIVSGLGIDPLMTRLFTIALLVAYVSQIIFFSRAVFIVLM